jgi:hypothetical protein
MRISIGFRSVNNIVALELNLIPCYCYRVVSGELFNQSWVQLDEEIRALQVRNGLLLSQ